METRLDAPNGKLIGELQEGEASCDIKPVKGTHNLYFVFPKGAAAHELDWFRFE